MLQDRQEKIVYLFQKGSEEQVRFVVRQYKDRYYVDVRLWFLPSVGKEYRPTRKGITLSIDLLSELEKGFEKAANAAQELALQPSPMPVK